MKRLPIGTWPALAVLLAAAWQWATVTANYGGNWTALYCTGGLQRLPPLAASEHVYVFAGSTGYDGQCYHYIAHDPFLRSDLKSYIDDPRERYRRILAPLAAYTLALGRQEWIDPAFELVMLLAVGLGVYWSCRLAEQSKLPAAWGLAFLLAPAIPIALDRMVTDAALAALTVAFLVYRKSPGKLFAVLACAILTRETGLLLIAAAVGWQLWQRQIRMAALFLLSGVPAFFWAWYVRAHTAGPTLSAALAPFSALAGSMANPHRYPPGTPFAGAVVAMDYLALAGLVLAFALALVRLVREPLDPAGIAAALFAFLGLLLRANTVATVYDFGRIYTPLLLCLAAAAARNRKPWLLAPAAMMLPRIAIQLTPQALGVVHRLL